MVLCHFEHAFPFIEILEIFVAHQGPGKVTQWQRHMTALYKVNLSHCVTRMYPVPRLRPVSLLVKAFTCCYSHIVIC